MAKNYQDAIPPEGGREYKLTQLPNGNYTIEDVTEYTQEGTPWGASDVNTMLQDIEGKMPKSGDTFTGEVKAFETATTARALKNNECRSGSTNGTLQSVAYYIDVVD